jgi:hypothetical protein
MGGGRMGRRKMRRMISLIQRMNVHSILNVLNDERLEEMNLFGEE